MLASEKPNSVQKNKRNSRIKARIRQAVYVLVIVLVAAFLVRLGTAPWVLAGQNWPLMIVLMATTGIGVVVQAQSFRSVSTAAAPSLWPTAAIWSVAAVVSVVAPFFAGIGARTALLMRAGMPLEHTMLTSLRQIWLGLEYALLVAALSLPFSTWPFQYSAAIGSLAGWLCMTLVRRKAVQPYSDVPHSYLARFLATLRHPIALRSELWFALQILAMSLTYYLGFNGMGAAFPVADALALAAVTVLISLLAFVPNGLGIADIFWVLVGQRAGLTIEQAVAVAILIRTAHLTSSAALYLCLRAATTDTFPSPKDE